MRDWDMKQESKEYYGNLAKFYDWRLEGDEEDIHFYVNLSTECGGPVLELGCGTGRVTLPVAEAGIECVGLDLSADMLDIARDKLSNASEEVRQRVQFVEGNMANFALERQFSLVILPANQFRELLTTADQLSCLRCVSSHLSEVGSVVIEISNPFRSVRNWDVGRVFHRKVSYCEETNSIVECLFRTTAISFVEQWIEQDTIYIEHLGDGSTIQHSGRSRSRYVFPKELDLLLNISGFEVISKWGGYERERLEDDSPVLIVQAAKHLK